MPTTNPFLCPPKKHRRQEQTQSQSQSQSQSQLQKRDNPFLSSRNNGNQNQNQFRNPPHNNQFRSNVINVDVGNDNNVIAKPLSFEESFPSLSECKPSSFVPTKLNFKGAIQTGQDHPSVTHPSVTHQSVTHPSVTQTHPSVTHPSVRNNQTANQFLRGNMFLCPRIRHEFSRNHHGMDDDHPDHEAQDAYDSAYTKYYNDY